MKRDCNTCAYKEGSCYPSTTIFDKDKTCKSYVPDYEGYIAELEKESMELQDKLKNLASVAEVRLANWQKCEKENAELKKWKEDTIKARGNDYMAWSRQNDQLTKANELILKLSTCLEGHSNNNFEYELLKEAEQFLKESEE